MLDGDGNAHYCKKGDDKPSGSNQPRQGVRSSKSFSTSYAKDIAVAYLAANPQTSSKDLDAIIVHYFNLFEEMQKE